MKNPMRNLSGGSQGLLRHRERQAFAGRLFLRRVAVAPILFYQYCISPFFPARCRFYPTCSAYALESVLTHGVIKGSLLAAGRLLRCHPWNQGGYDPVPPDVPRPQRNC